MTDPDRPYGAIPPPPPSFPPPGGPAGGPPGAPPHVPPASPGGGGLWIALGVLGVLALVATIAGLVVVLTRSDGGDEEERSGETTSSGGRSDLGPAQVVQAVLDAAGDDDCGAAEEHLTEDARAAEPCASEEFELLASGDAEASVGEADVDGDRAVVSVTFRTSEGGEEYRFTLRRSEETWLVDSYEPGSDAGADGPSASVPTDPSAGSGTAPPGASTADAIPNEPAAVVKGYLDSSLAGDCATADDLVTEEYLREEGRCETDAIPSAFVEDLDYTVGTGRVDEATGTARVPVSVTVGGQTEEAVIGLVKEDGRWLIDSVDEP